jgi:hypothetical protein
VRCEQCGYEVRPGSRFCGRCGTPVSDWVVAAPPAPVGAAVEAREAPAIEAGGRWGWSRAVVVPVLLIVLAVVVYGAIALADSLG